MGKINAQTREKGFTLIELTIVVAVIAILVVIAIPIYQGIAQKAAISAHNANVQALTTAAQTAVATLGNPSAKVTWPSTDSDSGDYISSKWLQTYPELPDNLPDSVTDEGYTVTISTEGTVSVQPVKYTGSEPGTAGD